MVTKAFNYYRYVALLVLTTSLLSCFLLLIFDISLSTLLVSFFVSDRIVLSISLIFALISAFYLFYSANYNAQLEKTKQAIYESEKRYRLLSELTFDYAFFIEVKSDKTLNLEWITNDISNLIDTSEEALTTDSVAAKLIYPQDKLLGKDMLKQLLEGKDSISEIKVTGKDNAIYWLKVFCKSVKNSNNQVTHIYGAVQNITQQKENELVLLKLTSEQQAILDTFPDILFRLNTKDFIIDYKNSQKHILYISPEYFLNKHYKDVLPIEVADKLERALKSCRDTNSSTFTEYWLTINNKDYYYEARMIPFSNQEILVIVRDITSRKKTEDALRESETRLSAIITSAMDAIVTINSNQQITFINVAAERMFLCSAKEVLGQPVTSFAPTRLRNTYKEFIDKFGLLEQTIEQTKDQKPIKGVRKNGEEFYIEASISKILSQGEKFYTIISRDITERRKAQQILLEKSTFAALEAEIGFLLAQSNTLPEILDYSAKTLVKHLNAAAARVWAYTEESSTLLADAGIPFPNNKPRIATSKFRVIDITQDQEPYFTNSLSEDPRFTDKQWIKEQGLVSYAGYPLMVRGKLVGVLAMFSKKTLPELISISLASIASQIAHGIARLIAQQALQESETELRQLNETLEQKVEERTRELREANEKLAKTAQHKDEFLASMSHELRTPLTGVLSLSEALQEGIYGPLNEKQFKALNTVEESGRHLLELINDILDLSKIEAGQFELQLNDCLVQEICQSSLHLIKGLVNKKEQTLSFSINPPSIVLPADPRRLKQVLVNLLSNAVKFTPEKGKIGLEVIATQQIVSFSVWDTGIGISTSNMDNLFKPFTQLDSKLSRQYSGTGLGLSLVKRLVELQGGKVTLESEVGKGSCFTVIFPWKN